MLCADCGIRPVVFRRTRCLECMAGAIPPPQKRPPYRPKDHVGKREALRKLIEAAKMEPFK